MCLSDSVYHVLSSHEKITPILAMQNCCIYCNCVLCTDHCLVPKSCSFLAVLSFAFENDNSIRFIGFEVLRAVLFT